MKLNISIISRLIYGLSVPITDYLIIKNVLQCPNFARCEQGYFHARQMS